jgi:hypothetical protein
VREALQIGMDAADDIATGGWTGEDQRTHRTTPLEPRHPLDYRLMMRRCSKPSVRFLTIAAQIRFSVEKAASKIRELTETARLLAKQGRLAQAPNRSAGPFVRSAHRADTVQTASLS